jgi:hypothetical protein
MLNMRPFLSNAFICSSSCHVPRLKPLGFGFGYLFQEGGLCNGLCWSLRRNCPIPPRGSQGEQIPITTRSGTECC